MQVNKEEILDREFTTQTEGITALITKSFPSEYREIVLSAMEEYASQWKSKYDAERQERVHLDKENDILKAKYDTLDTSTTQASKEMADAYERLHKEKEELKAENERLRDELYKAVNQSEKTLATLKDKAEKMAQALESISSGTAPYNSHEAFSWIDTAKTIASAAISEWNSQEKEVDK